MDIPDAGCVCTVGHTADKTALDAGNAVGEGGGGGEEAFRLNVCRDGLFSVLEASGSQAVAPAGPAGGCLVCAYMTTCIHACTIQEVSLSIDLTASASQ